MCVRRRIDRVTAQQAGSSAATISSVKGFEPVLAAAARMSDFQAEWFIVGGWAIDLFLGKRTRDHDDVDIGFARDHQARVQSLLRGWSYQKVVPRGTSLEREPWAEGEWLSLPVHEIHVESPTGSHLEFLLLERRADEWVYRRDARVRLPWSRLPFPTPLGLAALAPEVVLLFKAKGHRERDQADFEAALPRLSGERRDWLRAALAIAHPGHRWLGVLNRSAPARPRS